MKHIAQRNVLQEMEEGKHEEKRLGWNNMVNILIIKDTRFIYQSNLDNKTKR